MQSFTKSDFLETTKPYDYLFGLKEEPLQHEKAFASVKENAYAVGVRNFCKLYQAYSLSRG